MRGNGAPWANNALVLDEAGGGKKAKGTPFKPPQAPTGQLQQEE
jgi:hypothetical protein